LEETIIQEARNSSHTLTSLQKKYAIGTSCGSCIQSVKHILNQKKSKKNKLVSDSILRNKTSTQNHSFNPND